jgi:uncharacterized membrane protein YdbT with pleckstrin-like domain
VPADDELIIFRGHPAWQSMLAFHLKGFLLAVAAGVFAGLLSAAVSGHAGSGWVVLAVLAVFGIVVGQGLARRRRTTYTITSRRLMIEVGLLGREVHETRLEQIQNVGTSQSLLQRALDIGDVSFDTAGGAAFDFSFRGVSQPRQIVRTIDDALRRRTMSPV